MTLIKSYAAKDGDAFLLRNEIGPSAILIDGGYSSTYKEQILPDLLSLARQGGVLDLVVATHIDADHIGGLVTLFKDNGSAGSPNIVRIREVFHNGLSSLVSLRESQPLQECLDDALIIRAITNRGHVHEVRDTNDISAKQGSSLARLLRAGGYKWNGDDGTKCVVGNELPTFVVGPNIRITVLGPRQDTLRRLFEWWTMELRRNGYCGPTNNANLDEAFEFMSAHYSDSMEPSIAQMSAVIGTRTLEDIYAPDSSITNGSSISLIVEMNGSRILMLADSWSEDIEKSLATLQYDKPLVFDAIKISHHGSFRNTSPKLLRIIDSPRYFISTNGEKHNHPDFEVLNAIVNRPAAFSRTLYFNYATVSSAQLKDRAALASQPFVVIENCSDWVRLDPI